jgi:hypothetical protein
LNNLNIKKEYLPLVKSEPCVKTEPGLKVELGVKTEHTLVKIKQEPEYVFFKLYYYFATQNKANKFFLNSNFANFESFLIGSYHESPNLCFILVMY